MTNPTPPLLVSADPRLIESVQAAAAGAGIIPELARDEAAIIRWWRSAQCVVIGIDKASLVASLGLPKRSAVLLVGADQGVLTSWSVPLDASVLVLPDQLALLASVLDPRRDDAAGLGRFFRLVGGSGGLGVSTLVAALAQVAARQQLSAAVVELDPASGLDLVLGAESAPGWRWHDLRAAAGHIEQLGGRLPNLNGVDVVSHSRAPFAAPRQPVWPTRLRRGVDAGPAPEQEGPSGDSVRAVVASLTRSHRLVVADLGHSTTSVGEQWECTRSAIVVGASIRGLVAARARLGQLALSEVEVIVRVGVGQGLDPEAVAGALQLPLLGVIPDDRRLRAGLDAGDPPGRARGRYRRAVEELLVEVMGHEAPVPTSVPTDLTQRAPMRERTGVQSREIGERSTRGGRPRTAVRVGARGSRGGRS